MPGCALGYRRGAKGGTWVAKYREPSGKRHIKALGPADDVLDPDGVVALSFAQAQGKAREWIHNKGRNQADDDENAPYSVGQAVDDYLDWAKSEGRKSVQEFAYSVNAHIKPALGNIEVCELTSAQIRDWRNILAAAPARKRTSPGAEQQYRELGDDSESIRQRKVTANRVLSVLKAALNHAWSEGKASSDDAWRRVKPYRNVEASRMRYLSRSECERLINACPQDLRAIVQAALHTGARYGEICRLNVYDYHTDTGTIEIRESKSGSRRHVVLSDDGQEFFDLTVAGRHSDEPMFCRSTGRRWGKSQQIPLQKKACQAANIVPAVGFHTLRHTYASHTVMNGAPLAVVAANLGHSDERMTQKHYAHLAPNYIADTIRKTAPRLGGKYADNVTPLKKSNGGTQRIG